MFGSSYLFLEGPRNCSGWMGKNHLCITSRYDNKEGDASR